MQMNKQRKHKILYLQVYLHLLMLDIKVSLTPFGHLYHISDMGELVCEECGLVIKTIISEELTYREEQETSEKIVNYSYKLI